MAISTQATLVDSNIFIFSLSNTSPKQKKAQSFLESNNEFVTTQQNLMETYRYITHHKFPNPFTPQEAVTAILNIVEEDFFILHPQQTTYQIAFELLDQYCIKALHTFDAFLVATALSYDVNIIATDNVKDFKIFQELEVINPFK